MLIRPGPKEFAELRVEQAFTNNWIDFGDEIDVRDLSQIVLWTQLVIGNTVDARVRAVAKMAPGEGVEYCLPMMYSSLGNELQVQREYIEYDHDVNQNIALHWDLKGKYAYLQFQISAVTVGIVAGTLTAHISATRNM